MDARQLLDDRITELQANLEKFVEDANREVTAANGALQELRTIRAKLDESEKAVGDENPIDQAESTISA